MMENDDDQPTEYCAVYNHETKENEVVPVHDIFLLDRNRKYTQKTTKELIIQRKKKYGRASARLIKSGKNIPISFLTLPCTASQAQKAVAQPRRVIKMKRLSLLSPGVKKISKSKNEKNNYKNKPKIKKKIAQVKDIFLNESDKRLMGSTFLKLSSSGSSDDENIQKEGEGNFLEDNVTNEIEQADMSIPEKFLSFQIGECEHSKYKVKNAEPDGNCMYHSVIGALGLDIQVLAFKADLANFCTKKYPDNLELISKIRTDKIYGDDEVLLEISDFLKINICIHYLEKGGRVGYFLYTQTYASKTIHLTYSINPLHYNWLELNSIDIEEIEEAAEVEKLRKENVSLQQQLKHQSQDTLITISPIIEIISKTIRDELKTIRTSPETSSSTSEDSDFPIDHEGKAIVTEKFKLEWSEVSKIVRAKTMQRRTDYIVSMYWTKEESLNFYRVVPANASNGKLIPKEDVQDIKLILKRMQQCHLLDGPNDKGWEMKLMTWIGKKLNSDRNVDRMKKKKTSSRNNNINVNTDETNGNADCTDENANYANKHADNTDENAENTAD